MTDIELALAQARARIAYRRGLLNQHTKEGRADGDEVAFVRLERKLMSDLSVAINDTLILERMLHGDSAA